MNAMGRSSAWSNWDTGNAGAGLGALAAHAHAEMMRLCSRLEDVADSLPARIDRMACLTIASEIEPLVRGIHRFEEEALFPAYTAILKAEGRDLGSVDRLMWEHVEDECFAAELAEVLCVLGRGGPAENPEALGFMLRGFFESKRRHVAFEREHVLPMVAKGAG
ncbi:MAG: hemerythrin domain-containing protein [Rhizobiaceae bacterium]|nr:hemerythrin domain-containing protein [Rhizobiaceae bacterium]